MNGKRSPTHRARVGWADQTQARTAWRATSGRKLSALLAARCQEDHESTLTVV